ncbi:MAG: ABC transporter permease [Lachnospiraceae bacterium]
MEFIKLVIKNRNLIMQLAKNDFRNRFANTSLGSLWGFLQPFVFMIMYVVVFQYVFKAPGQAGAPYVVWFIPGISIWMTLNDSILNASNSIRAYSYLVKKVVFPVDVIPLISIISNAFVTLFLFAVSVLICMIYHFTPNILMIIYVIIATYCFLIAITRFTSAVSTLVPDFSNLLAIVMQLFFWATPVTWNLSMIAEYPLIGQVIQCVPFTYLVTAFRNAFMDGNIVTESHGIHTLVFWLITILIFIWGNFIFKKNKKDFADVL